MPEALIDYGIGETRALVRDGGRAIAAHVERADDGLRAGTLCAGRLARILLPGRRGIVACAGGEALLEPLPAGVTEGARVRVEVVREALPEAGRPRLAKVRAVTGDTPETRGPDLGERLAANGYRVRDVTLVAGDPLGEAGWDEIADAATSGLVAFDGGLLTISPTPAMTVIDVDGDGALAALAEAAAAAAARAIGLFDITGSIGVDFPTLADRAARVRLGALLDAHLPPPFERTAINGFGFVQIVRPRIRASLVERLRLAPVETAALTLLRQALRTPGPGSREAVASPPVIAWLEARPALLVELARRVGVRVRLRADPGLAIAAGHVTALA